ncbi:MAG: protein kinase [Candidatus Melainabacteria bacterium]|nr:protein kinase [Candidatus Melainabacteria bacterium]
MQADEIVADRYKVVRRLGAGAMGSIFQARDQVLHRDVAIKLLHPDPAPELVLRFQQEARAAASLEHRNIVRILDFGQLDNGQLYITMEMAQGRSLDTIIEDEGGLDPDRARSLLIDIAEGLEHCHRHGILHRDVKPANVMITGEPGHEEARIVDFGIAKFVKSESREELSRTRTGGALGSPAFMSPEAARGQELDQRSDVYSFGCLAFQMLSGKLPFHGESAAATLMMQIERAAPDLRSAFPGALPEDLVSMVSRCLEKEPGLRFPSFGAIIGALDTVDPEVQVPEEIEQSPEEGKSPSGSNWIVAGVCLFFLVVCAVFFLAAEPTGERGETGEVTGSREDASAYDRFPKLEEVRPMLVPVKGSGRFQVQGHVSGSPVEVLRGRRDINYLQFRHDDLNGDALSTIVGLPLSALKLLECDVDSKTFSYVKKLRSLKILTLSSCDGITPDCLREIASLPGLESIDLNHTAVDDSGLAMLCQIKTLEEVSLRRCVHLSDASLSRLAGLPRLKRLRIGSSGIEDGDTSGLLALRHLDELEVTKTPCSILRRLSLTSLSFYNLERFDASCLLELVSRPKLKNLTLARCPRLDPELESLLHKASSSLRIYELDY